jgi:hypothetical protein
MQPKPEMNSTEPEPRFNTETNGRKNAEFKIDNAAWSQGCPNFVQGSATCTTTNPVEVTSPARPFAKGISAPDGATSNLVGGERGVPPINTFIPKNGLLTLENGQYKAPVVDHNGVYQTFPITYAQQQELDFSQTALSPFHSM